MLRRPGRIGARVRHVLGRLGCLGCTCWLACAVSSIGPTDAELARGRDGAPEGAALFAGQCARCHGRRGEGVADAPAILGPGALPEYPRDQPASGIPGVQDPQQMEIDQQTRRTGSRLRGPFRNAMDVVAFVDAHLREPRLHAGAQKTAQDWAIVTFLMATRGTPIPAGGLTPDNASSVPLLQR
jgi:mono/diheme cytochrome c family protein